MIISDAHELQQRIQLDTNNNEISMFYVHLFCHVCKTNYTFCKGTIIELLSEALMHIIIDI